MAKPVHWLFPAFLSLARGSNITADDAIQRLQTLYPGQPVKLIVSNFGDMREVSRALEASVTMPQDVDLAALGQPSGQGSDDVATIGDGIVGPKQANGTHKFTTEFQNALQQSWRDEGRDYTGTGQSQSGTQPAPRADDFIRHHPAAQRSDRVSDSASRKRHAASRFFGDGTGTGTGTQEGQQQGQDSSGWLRDAVAAKRGQRG